MAKRRSDGGKERVWREVMRRQVDSGMSVRAFCRQEGIAESAFYFWRRTIRQRDGVVVGERGTKGKAERQRVVQGNSRNSPSTTPVFLPVVVTDAAKGNTAKDNASIEIQLHGQRVLRLPMAIAAARLAEIVHALEMAGDRHGGEACSNKTFGTQETAAKAVQ